MKRYEKYKDSGVEWIGEIPVGWEVKAFKRFAVICNGRDHKNVWDVNGEYPIIGSGGIFGRANKYLYDQPSVILGRKGTIDKPQFVTEPFWSVDTAYFTDIHKNTDKRFFYYLCLTINFDLYKYGSAVPSMTQETLSQIPFCSPIFEDQTTIANYLDRKTAEIDKLITQKERLLELYEEEKTAIINQAVTKGIDPAVKLKDSGIDWLGEIPGGWEVLRLRFLSKIKTGGKDTVNREDEGEYPFYVCSQTVERISTYSYDGEAILTAGDGVGVGKVFHYINGKFDYHQRVYKISDFNGIIAKYLFYYMRLNFHKEVIRISAKSTVDSLRLPMLQNFRYPNRPHQRQNHQNQKNHRTAKRVPHRPDLRGGHRQDQGDRGGGNITQDNTSQIIIYQNRRGRPTCLPFFEHPKNHGRTQNHGRTHNHGRTRTRGEHKTMGEHIGSPLRNEI
ncbi:MAG: restriction endonuclease subunit S [Thermodesulfobacteriota bacterium]|nr:restriction endonuclease subunit S [Thermodesulfobacteriota bacterium]